jgi:hypothetical protein
MNTKISILMKTFFCTAAFILTSIFSFANSVENNLSKTNRYTYKYLTDPNKTNISAALTLSYDVATFCAGAIGISKPKVSEEGGFFTLTRKSLGTGSLAFNARTGEIDHSISNPGVYMMTYKKDASSVSVTITSNKCN